MTSGTAETETERIARWRRDQARKLGFEATECQVIAEEWDIDLDRLRDLIKNRGCRPMTALRILR